MKKLAYILIFISCSTLIFSQQDTTNIPVELLEQYFEESTANENNSEIFDLIESLLEDPVDINSASVDEFLEIPFLDIKSAQLIVRYREQNGKFFSIFEISKIPGITSETYQKIKYFIKVTASSTDVIKKEAPSQPSFVDDISAQLRGRVIYDVKERKGFSENIYKGDRVKNYTRFKGNYTKNYRLGFIIEKDAGEVSFTDHYAFFVEGRNIGFNNQILAGDFSLEFGQGLVMWSPYAFSKGSDAINPVIRRASGIKGYTGSDENRFFRGGAFSTRVSDFQFSAFYSKNDQDANLNNLNEITSLPIDGFHRTDSEILKRNQVSEQMAGMRVVYSHENVFNIGLLYSHSEYSNPFEKSNLFDLSGKSFNYLSTSYNFYFKNIYFIGETAYNGTSAATLNTLQITPTNKFSFVVSIRSYPRNFNAIHSNGFGERGNTQNEVGIYTGLKWRSKIGEFNFYYDQFKFPYAVSNLPLPSKGDEFLVNYQTSPFKKVRVVIRYKNENKEDIDLILNEDVIYNRKTNNIRVDLRYELIKNLTLRTRVEYTKIDRTEGIENEDGFLVFQDALYKPNRLFSLYGRFIYFNTDSYASRIYEFENDLTGIMNNPGLFGKGYRFYIIAKYKIYEFLNLSAKYSTTIKPEESYLSSGNNLINSSTDDRLSIQLDIKF